jgi:hypothetical protein
MILGRSGVGKSASMRNIPEDRYSLVEVNGKPLPFKTKKQAYNTDDYAKISRFMHDTPADIIVIDDSQYLMANEFMRRGKEKGYEKFTEIGINFWNLINEVQKLPANKIVYFLHHTETDINGDVKEKTIGKMLDEKICIAGMFTIVLFADKCDKEYFFSTQSDGKTPAKTPMGMFDKATIDNDLYAVDAAIRAYYEFAEPSIIPAKKAAK